MIMGLDRTYHAYQFIFSFFFLHFLFVPCGRLSCLSVSFFLHVKYTVSYRIVSYRIVANLKLVRLLTVSQWSSDKREVDEL